MHRPLSLKQAFCSINENRRGTQSTLNWLLKYRKVNNKKKEQFALLLNIKILVCYLFLFILFKLPSQCFAGIVGSCFKRLRSVFGEYLIAR